MFYKFACRICFIFIVVFSSNALAVGRVFVENDTPIEFNIEVAQSGDNLVQGESWGINSNTKLKAWNKREVIWFNRNRNIKKGKEYIFRIKLKDEFNDELLSLNQKLIGTWRFSNLSYSIDNQYISDDWLQGRKIQVKEFTKDNNRYIIKYKSVYNARTASDDVVYVIHQVEPYHDKIKNTDNKDNEITVLGYNIYTVITRRAKDIYKRLRALPELIAPYDVIVFSEAFYNPAREELIKNISKTHKYLTPVVDSNIFPEDGGVFIASKYPIEYFQQIVYHDHSGSDSFSAKGAMYARIKKGNVFYNVFGTHTQAWSTPQGRLVREKQFKQLKSYIDSLNISKDEAVIIAGDLNVDKVNYPDEYNSMLDILQGELPPISDFSQKFSYDSESNNLASDGDEYLDYALYLKGYRKPIESTNAILAIKSIDDKLFGSGDLSDHYPVYGYFKFPYAQDAGF